MKQQPIPNEWLVEQLPSIDFADCARFEIKRLGISPEEENKLLEELKASARWLEKWQKFIDKKNNTDELWYFRSPRETWNSLCGRSGFAIVRGGQSLEVLIVSRS